MQLEMNDTEAMMWGLESNPNLASTMGSLMILEKSPDREWATASIAKAVAHVERLRVRVAEPTLGIRTPQWTLDTQFDLDHHLRFLRLPARASMDELNRAAGQWINDPFDRSRPLWEMLVLTGLPGGKAALVSKLHHSIADGAGALEMAGEIYSFGEIGTQPAMIDLGQLFDELQAEARVQAINDKKEKPNRTDEEGPGLLDRIGGVASLIADRRRVTSAGNDAVQAARVVAGQFPALGGHSGSQLWQERSRNRRFEYLEIPLAGLKTAAKQRGVRLNDIFVGACAEGVLRYHDEYGVDLPEISSTVVVSTRRPDDDPHANAFTPTSIPLPGHGVGTDERLAYINTEIELRRNALRDHRDLIGSVSGLAAALPFNLAAGLALDQASRVDIATSNLPGPPVDAYFAGQRILRWIPVGPVAGTAVNVSLLSYADAVFVGMHIDPAAIAQTKLLKNCMRAGFGDLGVRARIR
ncbi:MAG: wax ester/triacylglycerol synthase domain-containing protein [Acidimicrobiales bacterium]